MCLDNLEKRKMPRDVYKLCRIIDGKLIGFCQDKELKKFNFVWKYPRFEKTYKMGYHSFEHLEDAIELFTNYFHHENRSNIRLVKCKAYWHLASGREHWFGFQRNVVVSRILILKGVYNVEKRIFTKVPRVRPDKAQSRLHVTVGETGRAKSLLGRWSYPWDVSK